MYKRKVSVCNVWEPLVLYEWRVQCLLTTKNFILSYHWKHHVVLFLLGWFMVVLVLWFDFDRVFILFPSFPLVSSKLMLAIYSFRVTFLFIVILIFVLILLVLIFFFCFFYKILICFLLINLFFKVQSSCSSLFSLNWVTILFCLSLIQG